MPSLRGDFYRAHTEVKAKLRAQISELRAQISGRVESFIYRHGLRSESKRPPKELEDSLLRQGWAIDPSCLVPQCDGMD